tara:strand:- start:7466 stop:7966 length:501 start_codon:yes stop_codon:yes gene_type:complete
MKLLITETQKRKLLKEEPLLTDILKKAVMKAIESPEVQKIIQKGMENVIERGAGELKKFTDSPKDYINTLKANIRPSVNLDAEKNVYVPGEFEDVEEVEVEKENIKVKERPAIISKKEEIQRSRRYVKELTDKKGYKSRRDRDNIDLLKINIAKLERDLQQLYDEE